MRTRAILLLPLLLLPLTTHAETLPSRVNNAETPYFRNTFGQNNNECTQAAAIGYIFTYEINAARGDTANSNEHKYATHFTYNFLNNASGANTGLSDQGFNIAIDMGIPSIETYGGKKNALGISGWMTGYDKYYQAMQNRASEWFALPKPNTADNIESIKNWLYNRNGETSENGGLATMNTFVGGWKFKTIPAGYHEVGKTICHIPTVVLTGGHTMTYVGYDDSIKVDLNGDGLITNYIDITGDGKVNIKDWEIGAFIVANSHGANWKDGGFCYWMYSAAARHPNGVYGLRVSPNYKPTYTIKAQLTSSKRKRINIKAGIAASPNAASPDYTKTFSGFNYKKGGDLPMIDNANNNPIEIGLDISDLIEKIGDVSQAKIFLQVIADGSAGTGNIISMSCIDYTGDNPVEYQSLEGNIPIVAGNTATISTTLQGDINIDDIPGQPFNLSCNNKYYGQIDLSWSDTTLLETGFEIQRAPNMAGPWTTIDSTGINQTYYADTGLGNAVHFCYRVNAFNELGNSGFTNTDDATTLIKNEVKSINGWYSQDLGDVYRASTCSYQNDTFYVEAGDKDIWNEADAFQFIYKNLSGDGEIIAQVTSFEGIQNYTMAGVMMRESLNPPSRQASFMLVSKPGAVFRRRFETGAATTQTPGKEKNNLKAPYWLKLERVGNDFKGYHSPDGINWTLQESHTIEMRQEIYIGLAATSHVLGETAKFEFTNVGTSGLVSNGLTKEDAFKIYPVPAENYITILTDEEQLFTAEIISSTGKTLANLQFVHEQTFNTSAYLPGIYFVKIKNSYNENISIHKFIIRK